VGYELEGRLIWSLSGSGLGTTITAAGNSGAWVASSTTPPYSYGRSALDLQRTSDVLITVIAASVTGTTPSLTVTLGGFDDQGNLFSSLLAVPALTASGTAGAKSFSGGRHGASGGSYTVFPLYGQIAWTVSGAGATFTGTEICVFAQ
jgi:hypothetical protein